jgi:hypothetical protein
MTPSDQTRLDTQLQRLHLHHIRSHYQAAAAKAAEEQCSYRITWRRLIEGDHVARTAASSDRSERALSRAQIPR